MARAVNNESSRPSRVGVPPWPILPRDSHSRWTSFRGADQVRASLAVRAVLWVSENPARSSWVSENPDGAALGALRTVLWVSENPARSSWVSENLGG